MFQVPIPSIKIKSFRKKILPFNIWNIAGYLILQKIGKKILLKDLRSPKVPPIFAPHLRENAGSRKFGWVAETTSLLNWRTRKGTGGSNPPASAKSQNKKS